MRRDSTSPSDRAPWVSGLSLKIFLYVWIAMAATGIAVLMAEIQMVGPPARAGWLLAILLLAGLVSWFLSCHLAAPIETLRAATRRLAEGDLTARAGSELGERRDELAQLSHDFDRMAERMETLLCDQERLMGVQRRFLRDISHELRSPLARLGVALELARDRVEEMDTSEMDTDEAEGPAERTPLVEVHNRIESEAGQLSEMIDRLLDLSRLESGVHRTEAAPVDLVGLVRAVAADAEFEAHGKGCAVRVLVQDAVSADLDGTNVPDIAITDTAITDTATTDTSNATPYITQGTRDLLRSAIENVIRNAVRHTRDNTTVEVELKQQQAWAVITVRDQGPGVPEEELGELFQPFFLTSRTRDHGSGGTGLGLPITERAVQLHGGSVDALNAPDSGLIVEIRLPLSTAETTAPLYQI